MSGRFLFQNSFFHRLVGARGGASASSHLPVNSLDDWNQQQQQDDAAASWNHRLSPDNIFLASKPPNLGQIFQAGVSTVAANEIAQHRLVFFGEIHSRPHIVSFQRQVQDAMAKSNGPRAIHNNNNNNNITGEAGILHVVFEHFSFEMQGILDAYMEDRLSFDELVQRYKDIGTESHDLEPYRNLLEDAKLLNVNNNSSNNASFRKVQLHAGFLSRKYARLLMKEGEEACFQSAAAQWLPPNPQLVGTKQHYNIFESLITGRSLASTNKTPDSRFHGIFQAQLLKDVAMAHKINAVVKKSCPDKDKILVLVGNGHVLGYRGVPERVLQEHPDLAADTCVLVSHDAGTDLQLPTNGDEASLKSSILHHLTTAAWWPCNMADYIYIYQESPPQTSTDLEENAIKEETKTAYDKVGESAHLPGNKAKARAIMKAMRYTDEQIAIAGEDVHNFQGVGNPHLHANIQPGEAVLDVGSGLGIDSFIAQEAATTSPHKKGGGENDGFVLGIDISTTEVKHAQSCAQRRKLDRIRFAVADMEKIPLPDNCVDVVISNGAFCLVPDKEKAFREVYRVLKPGGRIAICTTTTRGDESSTLEPGVSWPICMKMFVAKNEILPICKRIGYEDIVVDESDSSMSMELPLEVLQENSNPNNAPPPPRNKVHVGSVEFSHLEDYDMDKLCARVCVVARKPSA